MNKKSIIAFVLIVLTVIVLLFNMKGVGGNKVDINLLYGTYHTYKSIVFFGFTMIGVLIGLFIK